MIELPDVFKDNGFHGLYGLFMEDLKKDITRIRVVDDSPCGMQGGSQSLAGLFNLCNHHSIHHKKSVSSV